MLKDNKTIPINKRYSRFYPALDLLGMKHSYPIVSWPCIDFPALAAAFVPRVLHFHSVIHSKLIYAGIVKKIIMLVCAQIFLT